MLWLLLGLLALAPLPFAGQPSWAAALLAGATGSLLVLWGGFAMASGHLQDAGLLYVVVIAAVAPAAREMPAPNHCYIIVLWIVARAAVNEHGVDVSLADHGR